ncbi:MAG: hypothetical protein QGH89_03240 [Candidatus Marinimicrobia bacterium]|nr:hypothetical protein [Candidatus Neomarinimicrobiota bacterium]
MKFVFRSILILSLVGIWSCSKSPQADIVMLVSANVHGQLDPCG